MEEILKLLAIKENQFNNGFLSIRIFSDGSGFIIDESETEVFEFENYKELKNYLT